MSLIPYSQISSVLSIADAASKVATSLSVSNRTNRALRDQQLCVLTTELNKMETQIKMSAVNDLTDYAAYELAKTAARFNEICTNNPNMTGACDRLFKMEAEILCDSIQSFSEGNGGSFRR